MFGKKKPKCANCNSEMIEYYSSEPHTIPIYVCPHVKISHVENISKTVRTGFIYCELDKGAKHGFKQLITERILKLLRESTENTIDDQTLLENANLALMLDLPLEQLPKLFEAAKKLGYAVGLTPQKSIESLVRGIGRESRKILDNIGIVFKRETAYQWYKSVHKLEKLTQEQRSKAFKEYAIKQIIEKAEKV